MKKNVILSGILAGVIVASVMLVSAAKCYSDDNYEGSMILGYGSMLLAFSLIFVCVKNYRDKHNQGFITFGKAFRIGLFISLIASSFYVIAWLIDYYVFIPDFAEKFAQHNLRMAQTSGASTAELAEKAKEMADFKDMYKNPLMVILFTYMEILPVGLVISLLTALVLKRKSTE